MLIMVAALLGPVPVFAPELLVGHLLDQGHVVAVQDVHLVEAVVAAMASATTAAPGTTLLVTFNKHSIWRF